MKKILTTTVMTAILATSGFAGEPVEEKLFGTFDFKDKTDSLDSQIMPSGVVNIGSTDGGSPVIASKWKLEEGSTMTVKGAGFKLTGEIKINPNDAKAIPVQCKLTDDGNLYYEYKNGDGSYYKLVAADGSATGDYVDATAQATTQPTGDLIPTMTTTITGVPQLASADVRVSAMIDMAYKSAPKTTTLNNIQVVYNSIYEVKDAKTTSFGDKIFYVYDAYLGINKTEVYSPTCYAQGIETLWCYNVNGDTKFNDKNLGISDVYVLGTYTISGVDKCYYTVLCDNVVYYPLFACDVTSVSLKYDGEVQGCISGGTVTFAKQNDPVLLEDSTTSFADDSSLKGKNQFKLDKATADGFTDGYLSCFPTLKYNDGNEDQKLNVSNTGDYQNSELDGKDTLESYLNSFGFYPDEVSISKSNIELLATKGKEDAIQIPQNYAFTKAAATKTHEIKANLHNVGVDGFTDALKFTGTGAAGNTMDTLEFSGDNRNLVPEEGVTYEDVNVTFDNANSWIAAPKNKTITFKGTNNPVVDIKDDVSIVSDVVVTEGANIKVSNGKTISIFGKLTFC